MKTWIFTQTFLIILSTTTNVVSELISLCADNVQQENEDIDKYQGTFIHTTCTTHEEQAVDGGWGQWTGVCSTTCGQGVQNRTRECNNPTPSDTGQDCVGDSWELGNCDLGNCSIQAVDGGWGQWTGVCSTTCGQGVQNRTRECNNPTPSDTGQDCVGDSWELGNCDLGNCSIQGFALGTDSETELFLSSSGGNTYTVFTWDSTTPNLTSYSAVIIDDTNITVPVTVDDVKDEGSFNITSSLIGQNNFGIYHVQLVLNNVDGQHIENMALHFQPDVGVTKVSVPSHVLVDTSFEVVVYYLSTGSTLHVEWFMDDNHTNLIDCSASNGRCQSYYNYSSCGVFNVSMLASNTVNYQFITHNSITVVNPVRGFSIDLNSSLINGNDAAIIVVTLDSADRLYMGNLSLDINFGDGIVDNISLNEHINTLLSSGYTISHVYSKQGQFSIHSTIISETSAQNLTDMSIKVWDNISDVLLSLPNGGIVDKPVLFQFKNHRDFGFEYVIECGDGNVISNNAGVLDQTFDPVPMSHTYTSPNIYEVTLRASNPEFNISRRYNITVQNPLTNLSISPFGDFSFAPQYPIPDGEIEFEVKMIENKPAPTDVKCHFSFELNQSPIIEPVQISYDHTVIKIHKYTDYGVKEVNVTCLNLVSRIELLTRLELKSVSMNDFQIAYPQNIIVNKTSDSSVKEDVQINITLFNCVRFPKNFTLTFDYGDGSSDVAMDDIMQLNHYYTERGDFQITVEITDKITTEKKYFPVRIGQVYLTVDANVISVQFTPVTFNITGPATGGKYQLFTGEDHNPHTNYSSGPSFILHTHHYNEYGTYTPYVIATFPTFTELVYLDEPIFADYNLSVLQIDFNTTVDLPPGDITVIVTKHPASVDLPNVVCIFDFGDLIDREIRQKTQTITADKPLIYHFTYIALGFHRANLTCYNKYDKIENVTTMTVQNECFPLTGIFDRQYSNANNPLRLLTSRDTDLSSRMPVKCADKDVGYQWNMYYANGTSFNYTPPGNPKGSIRFLMGKIPQGIYKVTLNVTLPETFVYEPTFVWFIKPPPFAQIAGGSQRQVKVLSKIVELDALTNSYDMELGYGGNENLEFSWICQKYNVTNIYDLAYGYDTGADFIECNDRINISSRGIVQLELTNATYQGYVVTVNVSVEELFSMATQLIIAVPGSPPSVTIVCDKCMMPVKFSVGDKSIFNVQCEDCTEDDVLSYSWTLKIRSTYDTTYWSVQKTTTTAAFIIEPYSLAVDREYIVEVSVTGYGREGTGQSAFKFLTNLVPYNGNCSANPPEGNASTTAFNIRCDNWIDEGILRGRDPVRDRNEQNPLLYMFHVIERTEEGENLVAFQYGGEASATEINLPVGDPENNYTVQIRVYIIDMHQGYNVSDLSVISIPPPAYSPSDQNDEDPINNMFNDFDDTYAKVNKGGNSMALMRLMESTASIYRNIDLPTESTPEVSTPMNCVDYTDYVEPSSVKSALQKKANDMVNNIEDKTPSDDSDMVLNPSDAGFYAKTLAESVKNKALFNRDTSTKIAKNARKLIRNIKRNMKKLMSPSDRSSLKKAIKEVITALSQTMNFWKTVGNKESDDDDITEEGVRDFFQKYYWRFPEKYKEDIANDDDFNDKVQKCLKNKQKIKEKQTAMANATRDGEESMRDTVTEAMDSTGATLSPGEGEHKISRPDLTLSVEKDSKDAFLNKSSVHRKGMSLEFDNETLSGVNDTNIELQVTVFEKSPYLHAGDASKITGQVMNIALKNENGEPIDAPLNMKIGNEGVSYFKEHTPVYDPDDPEQLMHLKTELKSDSDALIAYLKLEEDVINSIVSSDLYHIYVKSGSQASSSDYNHKSIVQAKDLTEYGYKVFVAGGRLKKGSVYIALKAIEGAMKEANPSTASPRQKRSADQNDTLNDNSGSNTTSLAVANLSIAVVTTGCRVYDTNIKVWKENGCSVLPFSTLNETLCRCEPGVGSIFSLSFAAPNMIDFSGVWAKFDIKNAAVYGTLIGVLVVYFILIVILRRKDKADTVRSTPTFLCDNKETDNYFYMVAVHTGLRPGAGTKSNVCFILAGEQQDTGVRLLSDGVKQGFETNTVSYFIMSTRQSCGDFNYIRLWHDNCGLGNENSWYLHKIVVTDLQTTEKFIFHCDKWFAIDLEDGMIDRIVSVVSNKECGFETAFSQQSRANLTENHLWVSLFVRPQKNAFTRVQRLSCLLMLLLLTMITNAMFFKSNDEDTVTPNTVQIGGIRLSLEIVYVSFIGCIITVPPIFIATYFFRNASAKVLKKKPKTTSESEEPMVTIMQKKKFPHWVVYIAWVLVALAVVTSAFFLLLYSMQWGKTKSEEWLTTFILSFIESIFLVDPFKVIIVAVVISFIMRKPVEDEQVTIDLDSVRKKANNSKSSEQSEYLAFRMDVMAKVGPPAEETIQKERKLKMKQKAAKQAFVSLIGHFVFAAVLYCLSYVNRDQRGFLYKDHIDKQLFQSDKYQFGFSKISSPEHLFKWTRETLIPLYFPTSEYNGDGISQRDKFFVGDMANLRLGLIRLRQVKVEKAKCEVQKMSKNHYCGGKYNSDIEEKSDLCKSCSTPLTTEAWKYVPASKIWGIPILGIYNGYEGGGYIMHLSNRKANTESIIDELYKNRWLDRLTRAVFVEFALYNANINVICYSIFLAEFPEIGGSITWVDTQCFRPTMVASAAGAVNVFLNLVFVVMILIKFVSLIKGIIKHKLKHLKNFWNALDIIIVAISFIGVGFWITKFVFTIKALDMYYENKDTFVNFQHIVVWEYGFNCLLGVLVFIATIRISSALGYNRKITELAYVLKYGASTILAFGFLFCILFFAFVIFGYLLFGESLYEYRNLFISFGSLSNTLIGKNSLSKMQEAEPIYAEAYFFVYVFFVVFTLLTMFTAILNNTIQRVRRQTQRMKDHIGIVDVVSGTLTDVLGLVGIHIKRSSGNKKSRYVSGKNTNGPISTAKIVDLIKDLLTDEMGKECGAANEQHRSRQCSRERTQQGPSGGTFTNNDRRTPRQIYVDFGGSPSTICDDNDTLYFF